MVSLEKWKTSRVKHGEDEMVVGKAVAGHSCASPTLKDMKTKKSSWIEWTRYVKLE